MKQFYILSFPRSGNTLLRTIIEQVFNVRTIGYNSEIDMSPILYQYSGYRDYDISNIGIKRHSSSTINGEGKTLFIMRDIDDCINSHYDKQVKKYPELNKPDFTVNHLKLYRDNCIYAIHAGARVIKYEDLVNGNLDINSISDFLGIAPVNELDFEKCKIIASEIYKKELEETK